MPIDSGLYSQQILPPALDPAKIQAEVIAQQDQLDEAKAKQQDVRDSLMARSILQSTGGDPDKAVAGLRKAGLYGAAATIEKSQNDAAKARGEAMKARLDNEKMLIERASNEFASALQNPNPSSFDTLRKNLAALPDDPDDPQAKQRILSDIGETFDQATTPQKLQQWSMRSTAALAQTQQQQKTLDNVLGQNHLLGATAMLADASDAADYGKEYQAVMAILPFGTEREAIRAKLPDPSQVTDANFGQVKQALVAGSMTPQEQTNRMNAETAAENAKKEPAGFTLGQGQTRFDAQGNKVASVAPRPVTTTASQGATAAPSDAKAVAQAIMNGDQPPEFTGLYRNTMAVRAELAKAGYPLTKATEDWTATKKYLTTLNGQQQTRLRQAVTFASDSLGLVQSLSDEWQGGRFPLLNKANLAAAKSGAYGKDAQSLATRLEAQIADLTSELGTVYKGGNSSTDESLKLAATNLSADWSQQTLSDSIKQIRQNLQIRQNSIANTGTAGTGGNQYDQQRAVEAPKSSAPALIYDPKTGTFKKGGGS